MCSEKDPYLEHAAILIAKKEKVSIGMLQRTFKIGFNRAARIMDQLYEIGVVGPEEGITPRKVLLSTEEVYLLLKHLALYPIEDNSTDIEEKSISNIFMSERISMYNNKFDYMEGHDFENYCAALLKNIGYSSIKITPGSQDKGIDIFATMGGVKYGIQCKCGSSNIGIKAIQEAFSGAEYYDCHVPVVLTNQYFTRQAKEMAIKINVLLWDRNTLNSMVDRLE